jgi:hypothetical protein
MIVLIFLTGALLGLFAGAMLCVRFIRQEVAGDIGPRLRSIERQLGNLEADVNLALGARYAELSAQLNQEPNRQLQ